MLALVYSVPRALSTMGIGSSTAVNCQLHNQKVYVVNPLGLIWRASDVVMNPLIFLLTHYKPKNSIYMSIKHRIFT